MDNEPKSGVSGVLRLDEVADNLELDVTVVILNQNRESVYYFSSYTLEFQEEVAISSPTNSSTISPPQPTPQATPIPTNKQNVPPTVSPTPIQTSKPTVVPSARPIDVTTSNPTQQLTTPQAATGTPTLQPSPSDSQQKDVGLLPLVDVEGGCTAEANCGECAGDCNFHAECAGNLECYRRPGDYGTPIPGCQGRGTLGKDYCYNPEKWVLRLRFPHCSKMEPCDVCQVSRNSELSRIHIVSVHVSNRVKLLLPLHRRVIVTTIRIAKEISSASIDPI